MSKRHEERHVVRRTTAVIVRWAITQRPESQRPCRGAIRAVVTLSNLNSRGRLVGTRTRLISGSSSNGTGSDPPALGHFSKWEGSLKHNQSPSLRMRKLLHITLLRGSARALDTGVTQFH